MLAAAIVVALAFWGPPPCAVTVHVAELEPGTVGTATTSSDGRCEVRIARVPWQWRWLCSTVVHEFGHVRGLGHSDDPLSPMFPVLVRTADACRGKRPARYPAGTVVRFP